MPVDPKRVQAVFLAVVEQRPGADRAALLDRECGGDRELRRRVEVLLRANDDPDSFLDPPAADRVGQRAASDGTSGLALTANYSSPDPSPGVLIAERYTLDQKLGEGGMGEVWVAKQTEPVKRKVALKLIKAGMDSKSVVQRFDQERQALAMMDHPNIAKVLDGGLTADRRPYFVMELVNGLPLTKFCDETKLGIKERLELFVPICQAVQHAHQKGIVHRDLKPANILVTMIDGKPVPKVIDFGVAKATGGKLIDESMSTQFGAVVGTLEYMSPEQAGFSGEDIDTRADIYSLGVILYELLTGLRPIDSKRLKKAALDEMIRIIREEEPSKPSTRLSTDESLPSLAASRHIEPGKLTALLRGELDWVVMKCLEKQRDRRYETANGLARDIQRYLADEVVEARPPSAGYRIRKFVRRHKGQAIAATLINLALIGGIAGTTWGLIQAENRRIEADQARAREAERADGEEKAKVDAQSARDREAKERGYAEAIAKFVKDDFLALTSVGGQKEAGGDGLTRDATLRDLLDRAAKKLKDRKGLDPRTEAELNWIIGLSYHRSGDTEPAIPYLERSVELRKQVLGADDPQTLEAMNDLAGAYSGAGYFDKAQPIFHSVVERSKAVLGPDHKDTLSRMHDLAVHYSHAWKEKLALPLIEETVKRRKATLGPDDKDTLRSIGVLAQLQGMMGNYKLAVTTLTEALKVAEGRYGPKEDTSLSVKSHLALALSHAGEFDRAIKLSEEVLNHRRATLEPDHPATLTAINNLAGEYCEAGKQALGLKLYEETLEIEKRKRGPTHPSTLIQMDNLGKAYVEADQIDRAITLLEESYKLHQTRFGPDHPDTLTSENNLAFAYGVAIRGQRTSPGGDGDRRLTLLKDVVQRTTARLGPSHPFTLLSRTNLCLAYRDAGNKELALSDAEDVVRLMRAQLGPEHQYTLTAVNNLATLYGDAERVDQAIGLLQEIATVSQAKFGPNHPKTLFSKVNLARAFQHARKLEKAIPILEETFKQMGASLGLKHLHTIECLHSLGDALIAAGKLNQALPLLEEETKLKESRFGNDHAETLKVKRVLGVTYYRLRQFDKTVPLFEELVKVESAKYGRDNQQTLLSINDLGINYKEAGRIAEAVPLLEEAYRAAKKYPQFRSSENRLLDAYVKTGKSKEAANFINELVADMRHAPPKDNLALAARLNYYGMVLNEIKKFAEAEPLLRECLGIGKKSRPDAWQTFWTQSLLGESLMGQKKYADAEPLLLKGYEGMKAREKTIPPPGRIRISETIDRLISLYTETSKPEEVKKWKAERVKYPIANEKPKRDEK